MKVTTLAALFAATALATQGLPQQSHAQTFTIFGNAVPGTPADTDAAAVTLGVKFRSTQAGTVTGIRFYRAYRASSSGYTVKLYSAAGSLIASARTTKDTCAIPCWEQVNFASPISLAPNTTYIAAYYTSNGRYAADTGTHGGLTNAVTNGPLVAPASSTVGGNGVYTYSTGFPNQTYQDSNYYVDVTFTPTAATLQMVFSPTAPTIPSTTQPGATVATVMVTWSNGAPFTGTLGFVAPNGNDNGRFALSGNNIVVNPAGPGVGSDGGTVQNITVQATQ